MTDIVSNKLRNLHKSLLEDSPISPLEGLGVNVPKDSSPVNKRKKFNFNLHDIKMMKMVKGGGGKEINRAQNYFFSKYANLTFGNNQDDSNPVLLNLFPKITLKNMEKLKKDKINQEMKYLEHDDKDVMSSNNISVMNQNLNLNHGITISDKKEGILTPSPHKKGIWSMLNKLIAV